ncbi:CPBP family intramembrane metalloprotease [Actinomyces sp. zg-332]|uniref:CPBP family intramembrane glutamic endopeptidase n=1 Tax=Actinomyces sp. zg-332 TaxID=2708340 RepID=UPI0018E0A88F|nr:CPBP family intramembrane glutamic endopeptidase [Actinomyces sp. zg-332]QPK94383.1 CPBP family intramembrane metalloprotease [Actinomyces sp. zg-332]
MEKGSDLERALKLSLFVVPAALIGGYFTAVELLHTQSQDAQKILLSKAGGYVAYLVTVTLQTTIMAFICGVIGYFISNRIGLMKPFVLEKAKLVNTIFVALGCGIFFSSDYWIFGSYYPIIQTTYNALSVNRILSEIFYGGVVEEIMIRLFLMSLVALVIWKLFYKKVSKEEIPVKVFFIANFITALLFALGHLPATVLLFGSITPVLLLRCLFYNGCFGLVFGVIYQKYGIQYAIITHIGCHIVANIIWVIASVLT